MESKTVQVPNISCDGCVNSIRHRLLQVEGVKDVEGSEKTQMVTVTWDEPATWNVITAALDEIEYPPVRV